MLKVFCLYGFSVGLFFLWLNPPHTVEAQNRAAMWSEAILATDHFIANQLPEAVEAIARARKAHAIGELDALVGLIASQGGQDRQALEFFESAIRHGSTEPLVYYWAARINFYLGQKAQAFQRMQQAMAIGSTEPEIAMGYTLMLLSRGQKKQALESLLAVVERNPNLLDSSLYPSLQEGAITLLGRILRGYPDQSLVHRTQGHLYWRAGSITAAIRQFHFLLNSIAKDADVLNMLARCQIFLGQHKAALELAQRAESFSTAPEIQITQGEIWFKLGSTEKAYQKFKQAVDALPRDAHLLARLAQVCTEAEKSPCAKKFFQYAILRDPSIASAHFGLALDQQRHNELTQAKTSFQKALAIEPGNTLYYQAAMQCANQLKDTPWLNQLKKQVRIASQMEQRFTKQLQLTDGLTQKVIRALASINQPCNQDCKVALEQIPPIARQFAQAHLDLKEQKKDSAGQRLMKIVNYLRPTKLLRAKQWLINVQGKDVDGREISLQKTLPLVPIYFFQ